MQFRRVIDNPEGICILHNDPGIAQNLEITEQKSELTLTNLNRYVIDHSAFCQVDISDQSMQGITYETHFKHDS